MKVVLVHGIFNTGKIFFWMKRSLEKAGIDCFAPSYKPADGRKGLECASEDLKRKIEVRFGRDEKISIIGFSMGGIISRYYLQYLGGADRCDCFISIATPHNGSYWAYAPYPTKGVKQLRPNSPFLQQLKQSEHTLSDVKLYSFWSPLDTSIIPSSSSIWQVAHNEKFYSLLHVLILFNRRVTREIINVLS